jgi:hypothetical protein
MGKVIAQASMSLDGFIADTNDQAGPLHDWYYNGDVEVTPGRVDRRSPHRPGTGRVRRGRRVLR